MIEQSDEQVWITRTGKRFYPRKNNTADICVTLSEALKRGLSPSSGYITHMEIKARKEKELELRRMKAEDKFGNINTFIFSKNPCKKKLEVVKNLREDQLLEIELDTIRKMLRTAGRRYGKNRYLNLRNKPGNNHNSTVKSVSLYSYGDVLYVSIDIQCSNNNTNINIPMDSFFNGKEYIGSIVEYDKYGDPHTRNFTYSQSEKAEVIRSILIEHIYHKYPEHFK